MRNLKRVLSALLVLIMCVGMLPTTALADAPFDGNKAGSITITVKDALSNTAMSGASVMLEDITAGREHNHGTQVTPANGQVTWSGLSSGWYRVTETVVPQGYILNSEEMVFYFDTEYQTVYRAEIRNRPETALHIYRIDPATQEGLANAGYVVYDSTGHSVAEGRTDENGYMVVPHLPAGDYTIQEVSAPPGYNLTAQAQTIHITETSDDPYVVVFTGSEKSTITIFNYDGKTGEPIQGSRWRISRSGGGTVNGNLVTNAAGLAFVTDVEPGTYVVEELAVAPGYVNQLKHASVSIGDRTEHAVVSLSNIKPGNVSIYVGDSVTGKDLEGCTFTLYDTSGNIVAGPALSNANGYVTFDGIEDGNYTVTAQPRKGYVMDNTSMSVSLSNGGDRNLSFTATPLGTLVVKAISSTDNASPISGCTFEVRKMDGTLVGEYTTDSTGSFQVTGLDTGYFTVKELRAPDGYVIETSSKTIYIEAGTAGTLTFTHRDRPFVFVQCYISGTTTPIPGSRVRLYNSNGVAVRDGAVGNDGTFSFTNLEPGIYRVEYVSAPDGYSIETFEQTVEVTTTTGAVATLYASRHSSIIIHKLDGDTKDLLPGASFIIRDSKGVIQDIVTTDGSGTAVTKVLDPGQYTIHEQFAPTGYVPTTTMQTIAVENNKTSTATFSNKRESAIVVYAYDVDGNPMANVSYILYNVITGQELSTKLTDTAGVAIFEQLPPGSYMVSQDTIPEGYVLTTPTQARIILNAGAPTYVRFNHTPKATIKMETVDTADGKAIPGAVYQIMNSTGSFVANYTADTNGEAESISLEPGTYTVKQIVAPEGYLLNTTTQTITVQRNRVNLAKFFNRAVSHIEVECVESGSNFGLAGATITIEDEKGKEVARGTTTEGGIFVSGDLTPGRYTVKVISTPDGYTCIQMQRTIEVTTGLVSTVKFEFTSNNRIIVNLTDASDSTKGLEGSTFRIEAVDSEFAIDIRTDKAGHAESPALENGRYMVHQITAPDGYILDQSYQWATVTATENTVLDFTNRRISALTIQALTEKTHAGLVGTFEVWEQNGKLIRTVTTDETGVATIEQLDPGIYVVREVGVPEGYTARTLTQTVTISFETPSTLNFYHTVKSALTVKKVDADTHTPLAEAEFRITKANGDFVGDYTTDASGIITVATLDAGTYNIAETKAPQGYVLDTTSRSFEIRDDQAVVLTVENHKQSELTIRALVESSRAPLAGAEFEILSSANLIVKTVTTDSTGSVLVSGLNPGTYTVRETKVPAGYTARTLTQTVTITYETPSTLDYFHTAESILTVNKKDAATGDMLQGASFRLTKANGDYVGDYTTNEGGQFTIDTLPAGDYVLTETKAPAGYVANATPKTFSIKDDQPLVIDITNNKQVDLTIRALTEGDRKPLASAEFEIYEQDGNLIRTVTTDESGTVVVEGLNPATYIVRETKVPAGYTALTLSQSVNIAVKNPATLDFLHTQKSTLTINKVDADTKAPLAGAKFRITKENGDFYGDYTTNEAGQIVLSSVPAGKYNISETQAPEGYVLDTTSKSFTIKDNQTLVLDITNHKQTKLTIRALSELDHKGLIGAEFEIWSEDGKLVTTVSSSSDGTVTVDSLNPGTYTVKEIKVPNGYTARTLTQTVTLTFKSPEILDFWHTAKSTLTVVKTDGVTGDPLAGAEYRITTAKGDLVGTYTTNQSGQIVIDELQAGTYNIAEIKAPAGYTLDSTSKSFTIEDDHAITLEFVNYQQTDLTIRALTEVGRKGLAGAQFDICLENGTVVKTVTSTADGTVVVADLNPGKYIVKEVIVPDGYTVRQAIQTVTITNEVAATIDFWHTTESTVTIVKTDAQTGVPLAGAHFRITNAAGEVVGDYTTNTSGRIVIASLAAGTYNITETKAPNGYVLDSTSKSFEVKDDKATLIELTNTSIGSFRIVDTCKQDGKPIEGAVFRIDTYNGEFVGTYTTNIGGIINLNLAPGKYTIYQTSVPNGYVKLDDVWNVTVTAGKDNLLEVKNERLSKIVIHMIDAESKAGLYGVELSIKDIKNNVVGSYRSDNEGNINLTGILDAGKYILSLKTVPNNYNKDEVPKTIEVKIGETTEVTWALRGHKGQVTIVTYAGEDNATMNIRKNTLIGGAIYQITTPNGKVVGNIQGDLNGQAYSGALSVGTYYFQQIVAPVGWQVNSTKFAVNVSSTNDNIRVEVYNKAANYATDISVSGTASAMPGGNVKYNFNVANNSTSAMANFFVHMKVPTDGMRAVTLYTGTYSGSATTYYVEYKTNMNGYRKLAENLNSKSSYSYGLSTQALGLQTGEYVTDIRMVFTSVVAGMKTATAASLNCYVLSTVPNGYQGIMRAECGALVGYYSNTSSGGQWGNSVGQSFMSNPAVTVDNGWVTSSGQFITHVTAPVYAQNSVPGTLPKTGY